MESTLIQMDTLTKRGGGGRPTSEKADVWAIGGCKGGIGKSFITTNFGIILGKLGYRTLLVDFDLGGANLHTWLGIPAPNATLSDFLTDKTQQLDQIIVDTGQPNLSLLNGAGDILGIANLKHMQKGKLIRAIGKLNYDYVLLDLGGGTNYNTVDFFLAADPGVVVVTPEPVAVENAYRFIKSAFYRNIRNSSNSKEVRRLVADIMSSSLNRQIRTPLELMKRIEEFDAATGRRILETMGRFRPKIMLNQVRELRDVEVGKVMTNACHKFFGIRADFVGEVPYHEAVWRAARLRRPFTRLFPENIVTERLSNVVAEIINRSLTEEHERESETIL